MSGHYPWSKIKARFTPEQRREIDAMVREMEEEMFLNEVRRLAGMTQTDLADAMDVTQATVSKMEQQDDMQVSTLRRIVEALGGELEIIAHLPRAHISIKPFSSRSDRAA